MLTLLLFISLAAAAKPKYGPEAVTLTRSHEFFRRAEAPDFWALIPYYAAQRDERSCSIASVTMAMNGLRAHAALTSDEELLTQDSLLKRAGENDWWKGRGMGGLTLEQLGKAVEDSLAALGLKDYEVVVTHAGKDGAAKLHAALAENERSDRDFIILNFNQGAYTGDADAGHIAPLGAYDAKTKRALVLDPDRKWYEPYWVSEKTLLDGMATLDSVSGMNRGYVWVRPAGSTMRKVAPSPGSL